MRSEELQYSGECIFSKLYIDIFFQEDISITIGFFLIIINF